VFQKAGLAELHSGIDGDGARCLCRARSREREETNGDAVVVAVEARKVLLDVSRICTCPSFTWMS
jgi:hypothetical protein